MVLLSATGRVAGVDLCSQLLATARPIAAELEQRTRALLATPSARIVDHALLLETLGAALGPHNVLALPYEALHEPATWERIRAFTGIADLAAGVDFSDRSVNVKRRPGEEVWRVTRRATTLSGGTIALPPDLARAVGDAFAPAIPAPCGDDRARSRRARLLLTGRAGVRPRWCRARPRSGRGRARGGRPAPAPSSPRPPARRGCPRTGRGGPWSGSRPPRPRP